MRSILLAPVLLVGTGCLVPKATVSPTASQLSISGKFGANVSNVATVTSDFDDLGLDDEEFAPNPRADLEWIGMHLSLSTMLVGFDGNGTAQGQIEIGNEIITAGSDVATELDIP